MIYRIPREHCVAVSRGLLAAYGYKAPKAAFIGRFAAASLRFAGIPPDMPILGRIPFFVWAYGLQRNIEERRNCNGGICALMAGAEAVCRGTYIAFLL